MEALQERFKNFSTCTCISDAQFGPPDKRSNFNKNRKRIDFDSDSDVVPPGGKGVRRLLSKE